MKSKIICFFFLLSPMALKMSKVKLTRLKYDHQAMYAHYQCCDISFLAFDSVLVAIQQRKDIDTILSIVSRESSFKSTARGRDGDYGWGQFTQEAALYHNLNYDSLCFPEYAVNAIIIRLDDLRERGYHGKALIIGYGAYSRDTSNMKNPALLKFDEKIIELKQFKTKKQY